MKQTNTINGQELREMFATATNWLEKNASDIDALNVFPVPDGDTGTNMLLTMRSSVEEAYRAPDSDATEIVQAFAKGALMGARGNSGVILSQIWRGLAESLDKKEAFTGKDMADALKQASVQAYKGISNPVEGTILTVIKDAAKAAERVVKKGMTDVVEVMEAAVEAASESVANTPKLLPVLKDAGVVDAGGQGLYTILEGALRYLRGEAEQMQFRKPQLIASNLPQPNRPISLRTGASDEIPFGYCTEFLLKGEKLDPDRIRGKLQRAGQSLIVVGDKTTIRVHVHTLDPGHVIRYGTSMGTLHQVNMRNMDEQYRDFLAMQKGRSLSVEIATIAVTAGDGLSDVFTSLGASAIVPGGQTMNPSTKEILQAVKAVDSDKIIILPNNKNIILTAKQVFSLTEKKVEVLPTRTVPQGVAAMLAFDYEADFDTNVRLMNEAIGRVRTIEVTQAVRSAQLDGLKIKRKQIIGLLDGDLLSAGDTPLEVINKILSRVNLKESEIVTIYYGADTKPDDAEKISTSIRERYAHLQIEVVHGGQPHYNYIISIE